ncbi:hypothetical protein FRC03_005841 [Tulasnella sp. 419]|nr:hypothetical protein FRC03_005841 [Tulasnella sp. 419]
MDETLEVHFQSRKRRRSEVQKVMHSLTHTEPPSSIRPKKGMPASLQRGIIRDIMPGLSERSSQQRRNLLSIARPSSPVQPSFRFSDFLGQPEKDPELVSNRVNVPSSIVYQSEIVEEVTGDGEELDLISISNHEPTAEPASFLFNITGTNLPEANFLREGILPDLFSNECPLEEDICCQSPNCQLTSLSPDKLYQCRDCFNRHLYCARCLVEEHKYQPFHRVRSWSIATDTTPFFTPDMLKAAGQISQLGHGGRSCPAPGSTSKLNVMDIGGIFSVVIRWCDCANGPENHRQLLLNDSFPATEERPSTGYMFRLLEHYHQLSVNAKISAWDYVQSLRYLTSAVDQSLVKNLYDNFLKVSCQWRVLQMMKRAGIMRVSDISPGSLTVRCPACPQPGVNLPEGWEEHPHA